MGRRRIRTNHERQTLDEAQAALIRHALNEADPTTPLRRHEPATLGGDPRRLRGIPAIGRGVTGAIPGTRPELDGTRTPR